MRAAAGATRRDIVFPRAWMGTSYDFSFSGLKTAARRIVDAARADEGLPADDPKARLSRETIAELAYGFQESVVDVLVTKTIRAAEETSARSIVLGGGVAANRVLRERLVGEAQARGLPCIVPPPALCTDNGAMIGAAGAWRLAAGDRAGTLQRDAGGTGTAPQVARIMPASLYARVLQTRQKGDQVDKLLFAKPSLQALGHRADRLWPLLIDIRLGEDVLLRLIVDDR